MSVETSQAAHSKASLDAADAVRAAMAQLVATAPVDAAHRDEMSNAGFTAFANRLMDGGTVAAVLAAEWSSELLQFLLRLLNLPSTTVANKTNALLCLARLARWATSDQKRTRLLPVAVEIGACLEDALDERKQAAQQMGTTLGKPHEYTLVLLMRCCDYALTGRELLTDFFDGDVEFAMKIVFGLLKVATYEAQLKENAMRCIYELSTPATYFSAAGEDRTAMPTKKALSTVGRADSSGGSGASADNVQSVTAFVDRANTLLDIALRLGALSTLSESITPLFAAAFGPRASEEDRLMLAATIKHFALFAVNVFSFSSNGKLAATWRQSAALTALTVLTTVYFPAVASFASLIEERLEQQQLHDGGAPKSSAPAVLPPALSPYVASVEASLCFLSLCCYNAPKSLLMPAYHSLLVAAAKTGVAMFAMFPRSPRMLTMHARIMQVLTNLDALGYSQDATAVTGGVDAYGAVTTASSGDAQGKLQQARLQSELQTLSQRLNQFVMTALAPDTASTLLRTLETTSPACPLLSTTHATFSQLCGLLTSVALDGDFGLMDGDAEEEELELITGQLDRDIAQLQAAVTSVAETRRELNSVMREVAEHSAERQRQTREVELGANVPRESGEAKKQSSHKRKTKKTRHERRMEKATASRHPQEFLCKWSGHLMKTPVRLPSGNVYELETLETLIAEVGHIDPVSYDAFTSEPDDMVDFALQRRIAEYQAAQHMAEQHLA